MFHLWKSGTSLTCWHCWASLHKKWFGSVPGNLHRWRPSHKDRLKREMQDNIHKLQHSDEHWHENWHVWFILVHYVWFACEGPVKDLWRNSLERLDAGAAFRDCRVASVACSDLSPTAMSDNGNSARYCRFSRAQWKTRRNKIKKLYTILVQLFQSLANWQHFFRSKAFARVRCFQDVGIFGNRDSLIQESVSEWDWAWAQARPNQETHHRWRCSSTIRSSSRCKLGTSWNILEHLGTGTPTLRISPHFEVQKRFEASGGIRHRYCIWSDSERMCCTEVDPLPPPAALLAEGRNGNGRNGRNRHEVLARSFHVLAMLAMLAMPWCVGREVKACLVYGQRPRDTARICEMWEVQDTKSPGPGDLTVRQIMTDLIERLVLFPMAYARRTSPSSPFFAFCGTVVEQLWNRLFSCFRQDVATFQMDDGLDTENRGGGLVQCLDLCSLLKGRSSFLVIDSRSVFSCILLLLMNFEAHKYSLFATVFHTPHASNAQQNIVVEGSGSFMMLHVILWQLLTRSACQALRENPASPQCRSLRRILRELRRCIRRHPTAMGHRTSQNVTRQSWRLT